MSGDTDYWARKKLDQDTGKTSIGAAPTVYVGLYTAAPTDAGGGTEVSGGSYARVATSGTTWNAAGGSAPATTSNSADIQFPTATADWAPLATPAVAFGAFDAASAGNLLWWDWLGNNAYQPFNTTDIAGNTIASEAHGFAAGDPVVCTAEFGGTLPSPIAVNTIYYVIASGLTADVFEVSTTLGGSAVDITASGKGMVRKVAVQTILNGSTVKFTGGSPGQLVKSQA